MAVNKRQCTSCGEEKPITEFRPRRRKCRECGRAERRARYDVDPEKEKSWSDAWHSANREKALAGLARYRRENRERRNAQSRAWRAANPEKQRILNASWGRNNPEKKRALRKRWYEENREIEYAHNRERRALKHNAPGRCYAVDWEIVTRILGAKCIHPNKAECHGPVQQDHVRPLSRGGTNHPTNFQPLCGYHNQSKHTDWVDYRTPAQIREIMASFQLDLLAA
jgi:hypothetical protein